MSRSGWETLLVFRDWWEALPDVREWPGFPPGCPGVAGRPSLMFGNVGEAFPNVREWSGGLL